MSSNIYSNNYLRIGKGTLLAKRADATDDCYFSLGDCPGISFTPSTEKDEAYSNEVGPKVIIDTSITSMSLVSAVTCRNIDARNLSLFLMSSGITEKTQSADIGTAKTYSGTPSVDTVNAGTGVEYVVQANGFIDLGAMNVSDVMLANNASMFDYDTDIAIDSDYTGNASGQQVLVADTDYQVVHDGQHGLIKILAAGVAKLTDNKVYVTATVDQSTTFNHIKSISTTSIYCHFIYAGNPVKGMRQEIKFYGLIEPTGEYQLIGDSYSEIGFNITAIDIHTETDNDYESIVDLYEIEMVS